jgi:hypothetical protein
MTTTYHTAIATGAAANAATFNTPLGALDAAVLAVNAELGSNPSGAYSTVLLRLNATDTALGYALAAQNLIYNGNMQIDLDANSVPDTWVVYSTSSAGALTRIATGGVDYGAFSRISWSGTNTGNQGAVSAADTTGGGVNGGWVASTPYIVSWWAKTSGMTGSPSGPLLTWNTAPTTTTWITQPVISTVWQRYSARIVWGGSVEPYGRLYIYMYGAITGSWDLDHVQIEQA